MLTQPPKLNPSLSLYLAGTLACPCSSTNIFNLSKPSLKSFSVGSHTQPLIASNSRIRSFANFLFLYSPRRVATQKPNLNPSLSLKVTLTLACPCFFANTFNFSVASLKSFSKGSHAQPSIASNSCIRFFVNCLFL